MLRMENDVLDRETTIPPTALRNVERALEPRYSAYLEEVRRLIYAGLAEVINSGSVEPRVADIVRRAGLSNKAFYRHFRSKEELMLAVLEEAMRLRVAEFEKLLSQAESPLERVRLWIWGVLEQAMNPKLSAATRPLVVHQGRLLESLGPQLYSTVDRLQEPLKSALADARDADQLPDVEPECDAEILYSFVMGFMQARVVGRVIPSREECQRVVDFAMRGLTGGYAAL